MNDVNYVSIIFFVVGIYSLIGWKLTKDSENPIKQHGSKRFLMGIYLGFGIGIAILLQQIIQ